MTLAAVIAECVSITSGVTGVGVVRGYEEFAATEDQLRALFLSGGVVNAIEITRGSTESIYFANQRTQHDHTIHFHFYRSMQSDGTSRTAHQALVEATVEVFRNNFRLSGVAAKLDLMQIVIDGHIMKTGALLHYSLGTMVARIDLE